MKRFIVFLILSTLLILSSCKTSTSSTDDIANYSSDLQPPENSPMDNAAKNISPITQRVDRRF